MYLIRLMCSCEIELPLSMEGPKFLPSHGCLENHDANSSVRDVRIKQVIFTFMPEYDFDYDELTGNEVFH